MSISGALYSALSSMAAEQAQAQVIANNIANANTEGYVRRVLPVRENFAGGSGQGVAIGAVQRAGDALLESGLRAASSENGYGATMSAGLDAVAQAVGSPADGYALTDRLAGFQAAMTTLSATPSDGVAQSQALGAAQDLAAGFNALARTVADARVAADRGVAEDVEAVNRALGDLRGVETGLARAVARGDSTAALEDQRAGLLADIAARVPVRVLNAAPGQLVLRTDQGTTLLDGFNVHPLRFAAAGNIGASNQAGNAVLVDGQPLRASASGSIAARLQLRDATLPAYGQMLDQMAANLAGGFQAADPTTAGTTPRLAGLFTRGGAATLDTTRTEGMAMEIAVNPKVAASPRLLRDGANAGASGANGALGNAVILAGLARLEAPGSYSAAALPASATLGDAAAQAMGLIQSDSADWAARAAARGSAVGQARQALANGTGVSTDEELQKLLVVQSTYAASAQVVQVVARMLDTLNSIAA